MKKAISVALSIMVLSACQRRQTLSPGAFVRQMEQDYVRKVVSGKNEYTIQYASPAFMICKEMDGQPVNNSKEYNQRMKDLHGYVFFIIRVKSPFNQSGSADAMVMYYQQDASRDLTLFDGGNELKPAVWNYENNYGLTPYNTIVAGFECPDAENNDLRLVFNDHYTHVPMIKASFSRQELKNAPVLAIN